MLRDLQKYIATHGTVSMVDLARHFHTDSATLKPMLHRLIRRGRVHKLPAPHKCADCTCCDLSQLEFYQWRDQIAQPSQPIPEEKPCCPTP